jgi:hypothetical protein
MLASWVGMVVVLLSVKSLCAAKLSYCHYDRFQPSNGILAVGGWWLVAGGWWLVAGGWWLVAGGWWQLNQKYRMFPFVSHHRLGREEIKLDARIAILPSHSKWGEFTSKLA